MNKLNYLFSVLLFGIIFLFALPCVVFAVNVPVIGRAKIEATEFFVRFSECPSGAVCNVTIDNTNGIFSGRAFSDDLGPVEFGTVDNPDGPVSLNLQTGVVSGMAMFLNTGDVLDFNASPNSSNVTVDIPNRLIPGHAWSVSNGYINFSDPGVTATLGAKLINVPGNLVATTASDWSTSVAQFLQLGNNVIGIKDINTGIRIAEMNIDFASNIDWSGVTGDSEGFKAFFHAPTNVTEISGGASDSYSLYVVKGGGEKVWICPGVESLEEFTLTCSEGFYLSEGETLNGATASVVTEDGIVYWKISGLTGTGGMSVITGLKDTLTRLKVATPSNHIISFGTNNGITTASDNMVIKFQSFDLSTVVLGDIQLSDTVPNYRTLAGTPSANTWGVTIGTDNITFKAPSSGTGYFSAFSYILIKINNNHMVNPVSAGSYFEIITIYSANPEEGTIQIPIVDSDQVDITGYITSTMMFDLDTATDNSDCASTGAGACHIYGGANGIDGTNYTVDLGELAHGAVNRSGDSTTHATGGGNKSGEINYIYFDLSTNASSGAVITYVSVGSRPGYLNGPGTLTEDIPGIGGMITAGSANYGIKHFSTPTQTQLGDGASVTIPTNCEPADITFCAIPITETSIYSVNGSVESARGYLQIAAAIDGTMVPGTYNDVLQFIATATF